MSKALQGRVSVSACVFVCVCVYVCMYVCLCLFLFVCIYVFAQECVCDADRQRGQQRERDESCLTLYAGQNDFWDQDFDFIPGYF